MPSADRRDRTIARVFDYIDLHGVDGKTAEVSLELVSGDFMTVRAGGPGVRSGASAPFGTYEVLVDHDPPRFWHRYTDSTGMVFAYVPRLLIAHHVSRHGAGIANMDAEVVTRTETAVLNIRLAIPPALEGTVLATLAAVTGVSLLGSNLSSRYPLQMGV